MPGPLPPVYPDLFGGFNREQMPQAYDDTIPAGPGREYLQGVRENIVTKDPEKEAYSSELPAPEVDQSAGNDDRVEGSGAGAVAAATIFQGMFSPMAAKPPVMDEGSNYLPVGGPYGREMVNEAFNVQPKRMAKAVDEGAQAQQQESKAKEALLATERDRTRDYEAALKEQYMLRQQEMMRRQQEFEKTAQTYTNNLADQGAFWHNPQNVMAAMGAALMNLATDDRSFGYKLLNGAIQGDLHNRRALADQHLGYLKSNMAEYDRMAGDRISGMQLAEAEAKRVAAIELERIAAQFQGPKAKANAEAITSKLWQDVRTAYMQFYKSHIYNKPHREDPGILQSYQRGGQAEPGVGYTRFADPSNPTAGQGANIEGMRPQGKPGGPVGAGAGGAQGMGPQAAGPGASVQSGTPGPFRPLSDVERKNINARYQGGDKLVEIGHQDVARRAYISAGVRPGTPPQMMSPAQIKAFNTSVEQQEKEAYEQLKSVSGALGQSSEVRTGMRVIQTDMEVLEAAVKEFKNRGLQISMDDMLGTKSKAAFGSDTTAKWKNLYDALAASSPENRSKWENQKAKVEAAGTRLNQLMAGQINAYYKEHAGAAVTATELPRLKEYAGGNLTYDRLRTFIDNESKKYKGAEDEMMLQLSPAAQALWLTKKGVGSTKLEGPNVRKYQGHEAPEEGRGTPSKAPIKTKRN